MHPLLKKNPGSAPVTLTCKMKEYYTHFTSLEHTAKEAVDFREKEMDESPLFCLNKE